MSVARLARTIRSVTADERGVALPTVMIFMLAGVLLSLVVSSTVLGAYTFSSTTRANVQAQASAEAGIATARAALLNNDCTATNGLFTSAEPEYSVQVYRPSGGGWVAGCPTVSEQARIVATGTAASKGVSGASDDDVAEVEAVLGGAGSTIPMTASGPAIYAYDATGFGGSGTLISSDGTTPDVLLQSGNANCNGGSTGAVNLVLKSGTFTASGSCRIAGDVWVNGTANISGGAEIGGSLTATTVNGSGKIGGNVWADNAANLSWSDSVSGWVSAGSLVVNGGSINGKSWARTGDATFGGGTQAGGVQAAGKLTLTGGTLGGGKALGVACFVDGTLSAAMRVTSHTDAGSCKSPVSESWWGGWSRVSTSASIVLDPSPSKPTAKTVPGWVDFGSKPEHYTPVGWGSDYVVYTIPASTNCDEPKFHAALQAIGSNKGIIDARACSNGIDAFGGDATNYYEDDPENGHNAWRVRNDLVIIDNKFNLGNGSLNGFGGEHEVWLINPDTVANSTPDCAAGEYMSISGGVKFNNIKLMIYSPCQVSIASSTKFKGQIFAHYVTVAGGAQITYAALGLPGYDLNTGTETAVVATEWDRPIVSQRNITG